MEGKQEKLLQYRFVKRKLQVGLFFLFFFCLVCLIPQQGLSSPSPVRFGRNTMIHNTIFQLIFFLLPFGFEVIF